MSFVPANVCRLELRALSYPTKLIAKNASVVVEKVLSKDNTRYGYNSARNCYKYLMEAGIMDPTKVVQCCLEHAALVAKVFRTSDVVHAHSNQKANTKLN
ncbi:hypothetical protein HRI_002423200 [Hibiscus trionum]|uniref:Uncharacterized protein n=1 Tax=Hibiscus trionum TaxID=183268 RepID=A0A9W7HZQ5_HIBTR|nr:hypothetical protein HRI_002423200 [Hibiscus trionum]